MASQLNIKDILYPGQQLTSPNGNVTLSFQADGDLVLYIQGDPVWHSVTATDPSIGQTFFLEMQSDGNLCMYNQDGTPQWSSGTQGGVQSAYAQVTDSGQLIVVTNGSEGPSTKSFPTTPTPGQTLTVDLLDPQGNPVYEEIYAYGESEDAAQGVGRKLISRRWLNDSLKPDLQATDSVQRDNAQTALEATKFAWQFIQDNQPVVNIQNTSTAILNQKDGNPMDYQGASNGQSPTYTFRGTVWPTNLTQWEIKINLAGAYNATPVPGSPADQGFYLPSVQTVVPMCNVYWPYSANASAAVGAPVNVGTGTVNAQVDVICSVQVGSFADSFNLNLKFRATGSTGFSLVSAG